jgi:ring-1,2-phenylacetyl-CoA epoxidase subunit PaaD
MIRAEEILDVLRTIPDPEMPVSIVDLGLIEDVRIEAQDRGARVAIDLLPTFIGCPAIEMIAGDITRKVGAMKGVSGTDVRVVYDPPWSVDRISAAGRASLRAHGVTVPERGSALPVPGHSPGSPGAVELRTSAIPCPFCESDRTRLESMFGPTKCRMIYYCDACRNTFEHMKRV